MQKIFYDTRELDKAARENFGITEDIMMENAACALEEAGRPYFFSPDNKYINRPAVLILAGAGNNGADGYVLARRIVQKKLDVAVCQVYEPKSAMRVLQAERAKKAGAIFISTYDLDDYIERTSFDLRVVYDCIFGSGFHGTLDPLAAAVIKSANSIDGAYKIACDIPTGCGIAQDCSQDKKAADENRTQAKEAAASTDCKSANDSGIDSNRSQDKNAAAFNADLTVTMGALKLALFSDAAKDACGKIVVADLGISRSNFEAAFVACSPNNNSSSSQNFLQVQNARDLLPCAQLLEADDARLPLRNKKQNSNKGTYGHTAIFAGTKPGAAVIAGHAALKFGSGLVTLVSPAERKIQFENVADFELMASDTVPKNSSALVAGPGLGRPESFGLSKNCPKAKEAAATIACGPTNALGFDKNSSKDKKADGKNFSLAGNPGAAALNDCGLDNITALFNLLQESQVPAVLDADIFYWPQIKDLLAAKKNVVLTPHPKEFSALLKNVGLGIYSVEQVVERRFELAQKFAAGFPGSVLLLKGANVFIASKLQGEEKVRVYINPLGTSALAKGGSGDVLAGMIGALLAQGYETLEAAVTASIRHASASRAFDGKDYALAPFELMKNI